MRSRLGLAGVPREQVDTGGNDRRLELGDDVEAAKDDDDDMAAPEGFFDRGAHSLRQVDSFHALGLSRALLRAVADCAWTKPSPVQAAVVPVALEGRDLAVSAVTGSGKTGAFALPAIERLLLKPPGSDAAIRVLVLVPTRELAVQCDAVFGELTRGTGLTRALCVGGSGLRAQEAQLRERPDIVIGTPGRLVDLLLNAPDFGLEDVEMLVLDEADRLLDMGFSDQIKELVRHCPRKRQTLLFSATMTENVNALAALSLQRPVRVAMPSPDRVVSGLRQEFVRVRSEDENRLHAMALYLLAGPLADKRTIVFVGRKKTAHRLNVLLMLAGHSSGELQGSMSQAARLEAMEEFRRGTTRILVATDVASRGLDTAVDAVLNVDMPLSVKDYIHRVGRTARAGRTGLSVSLVKEGDRALVKAIVKEGISDAARRKVPPERMRYWGEQIESWQDELRSLMNREQMEREVETGLREVAKAENMVVHQDEILARPKREWFQSAAEKTALAKKVKTSDQKKEEKKRQKKSGKEEEKKKNWIPEEEMAERRAKARELQQEKKAATEQVRDKGLLEFRDEASEKRARIVKELAKAAKGGDGTRGGTKRALVAQQMRLKDDETKKNAHRHERKEAHKKGFKSLGKFKRRR